MFFMPWTPQKHKFHQNTVPPCIPWIRWQKDDDETFSHGRDPDCPVELVWVAVEKLCDAPDRPLYNRLTARHNADAALSRVFCNPLIWATIFCTSEQSNDKTSTINLQNLTFASKSVGHRGNSSKPQHDRSCRSKGVQEEIKLKGDQGSQSKDQPWFTGGGLPSSWHLKLQQIRFLGKLRRTLAFGVFWCS